MRRIIVLSSLDNRQYLENPQCLYSPAHSFEVSPFEQMPMKFSAIFGEIQVEIWNPANMADVILRYSIGLVWSRLR